MVSLGADLCLGSAQRPHPGGGQQPPFVFLSIFKWEARKGWEVLLGSYLEEFDSNRGAVELHILTRPFMSRDRDFCGIIRKWAGSGRNLDALPRVSGIALVTSMTVFRARHCSQMWLPVLTEQIAAANERTLHIAAAHFRSPTCIIP